MSVECSICERDLRGGHSIGCPRYRDPEPCQCGHADIDHDEEGVCHQCNCGLYKPSAASPVPPSAVQEGAPSKGHGWNVAIQGMLPPAAAPVEGAIPTEPTPDTGECRKCGNHCEPRTNGVCRRCFTLDVGESKRICEAATPAPWTLLEDDAEIVTIRARGKVVAGIIASVRIKWVHERQRIEQAANARFIAHARSALPAALDRLDFLESENDRLLNELAEARPPFAGDPVIEIQRLSRELAGYREVVEAAKGIFPHSYLDKDTGQYLIGEAQVKKLRAALASLSPTLGDTKNG
jgi:hypothetical protein